jgi:hypothetical protein
MGFFNAQPRTVTMVGTAKAKDKMIYSKTDILF